MSSVTGVSSSFLVALFLAGVSSFGGLTSADAELPVASPESQGMSSRTLREMSVFIRSEELDVRSLIVLRNGHLVFEWYAGGVTRDHNHNVFSVTKSVVATLTGIAIDSGKVSDTSVTLGGLFPDSEGVTGDALKAVVCIDDLLTMRSGFRCARGNKASGAERDLFDRIQRAPDRLGFILGLDMVRSAGEDFVYGNAEPQVMLAILEGACDRRAMALGKEMLFDRLDFQNVRWLYPDATGLVPGGYGLRLRAIDLAKLGQLYLAKGRWDGRQVVSETWVDAATANRRGTGYGYYWWTGIPGGDGKAYAAKGVRGQQIYVDPDRGVVFVVTADLPADRVQPVLTALTQKYVIVSIHSERALPEDEEGTQALEAELRKAMSYVPESRGMVPGARLPQLVE